MSKSLVTQILQRIKRPPTIIPFSVIGLDHETSAPPQPPPKAAPARVAVPNPLLKPNRSRNYNNRGQVTFESIC